MGLVVDRRALVTALLLLAALLFHLAIPDGVAALATRRDSRPAGAEEIPFERPGAQGLIRGVVVARDGLIEDVRILSSVEGVDRIALRDRAFLDSFRGKPIASVVMVDMISGATISSQAVIDGVNACLRRERSKP